MEALGVLGVVAVIGIIAINYYWSIKAKRTDSIGTSASPERALQIAESSFSRASWAKAPGPGQLNKRMRTIVTAGPVLSVDVQADGTGSRVDVWTSSWSGALGLVNWAAFAVLKKRKLVKALSG